MVTGLPYPEILDLTWGEIIEFVKCKEEARKTELREQANMDFTHAMLVCKMLSAKKGKKFKVAEEYPFLWSESEREEIAIANFEKQMLAPCKKE
jgi:hypothetical protein